MLKYRTIPLVLAFLVVGAVIAGCASINGSSVSSYNIKDEVAVGKTAWKILSVEKMKTTASGAKAVGEFVFVQAQLKNTSNEAANLTGVEVELVDGDHNTYMINAQDNNTYLTAMGKDGLIKGRVEPGETVTGWIAFDVAEQAKDIKMRVRDLDVTSSKSALVDLKI